MNYNGFWKPYSKNSNGGSESIQKTMVSERSEIQWILVSQNVLKNINYNGFWKTYPKDSHGDSKSIQKISVPDGSEIQWISAPKMFQKAFDL